MPAAPYPQIKMKAGYKMEKELTNKLEVLMYRLIKAGRKQCSAKRVLLNMGGTPCDLTFAKEALQKGRTEAGEVRDELFELLVRPENRESVIQDEAFCNDFENYIQRIWGADQAIIECEREIVDTENMELEKYLRKRRKEQFSKLLYLKTAIVDHLISSRKK